MDEGKRTGRKHDKMCNTLVKTVKWIGKSIYSLYMNVFKGLMTIICLTVFCASFRGGKRGFPVAVIVEISACIKSFITESSWRAAAFLNEKKN